MATEHDNLIIGQGIAGTVLAWKLLDIGQTVCIYDDQKMQASQAAAGLINPVTGMRFVKTKGWEQYWTVAKTFYRQMEQKLNKQFLTELSLVRLFQNEKERTEFQRRRETFADLIIDDELHKASPHLTAPYGGYVGFAARLELQSFLESSRRAFINKEYLREESIDPDTVIIRDGLCLAGKKCVAQRIIFCEGVRGAQNPWFPDLRFSPVKGEVLRLKIPKLQESRVINCGVWLIPLGQDHYLAGSTYNWNDPSDSPTTQGRDHILSRLRRFLTCDFEVVDHKAGIRPAATDAMPQLVFHHQHPQLIMLNGLGSKGALQAPGLALKLVHQLSNNHY